MNHPGDGFLDLISVAVLATLYHVSSLLSWCRIPSLIKPRPHPRMFPQPRGGRCSVLYQMGLELCPTGSWLNVKVSHNHSTHTKSSYNGLHMGIDLTCTATRPKMDIAMAINGPHHFDIHLSTLENVFLLTALPSLSNLIQSNTATNSQWYSPIQWTASHNTWLPQHHKPTKKYATRGCKSYSVREASCRRQGIRMNKPHKPSLKETNETTTTWHWGWGGWVTTPLLQARFTLERAFLWAASRASPRASSSPCLSLCCWASAPVKWSIWFWLACLLVHSAECSKRRPISCPITSMEWSYIVANCLSISPCETRAECCTSPTPLLALVHH